MMICRLNPEVNMVWVQNLSTDTDPQALHGAPVSERHYAVDDRGKGHNVVEHVVVQAIGGSFHWSLASKDSVRQRV